MKRLAGLILLILITLSCTGQLTHYNGVIIGPNGDPLDSAKVVGADFVFYSGGNSYATGVGSEGDSASYTYRIIPQSATPTPATGLIYYDSDDDILRVYNGVSWDSLNVVGGGGGGDVLISGTPVDNQIAVWTNANTIEGTTGLTFDGTDLVANSYYVLDSIDVHTDTLQDHNLRLIALESSPAVDSSFRTVTSDTIREWSLSNGIWADSVLMKDGIVRPLDGKLYLKNSTNSIELDGSGNLQLKDAVNGAITLDEFINLPDTAVEHNNRLLAIEQAFVDSADIGELAILREDTLSLTFCKGGSQAGDTVWVLANELIGSKATEESDTLILTRVNAVAKNGAGYGSITYDIDVAWDDNLDDATPTRAETSYITCTSITTGTDYTAFDNYMILPGQHLWVKLQSVTAGSKPTFVSVTLFYYKL